MTRRVISGQLPLLGVVALLTLPQALRAETTKRPPGSDTTVVAPPVAAPVSPSAARPGDPTCHSACLDYCAWGDRFFSSGEPYNSDVWPTNSCVTSLPCFTSGGCNVLNDEFSTAEVDNLVAAVRSNDVARVSRLIRSKRSVHVNVERQLLQVEGCSAGVLIASVRMSPTMLAVVSPLVSTVNAAGESKASK